MVRAPATQEAPASLRPRQGRGLPAGNYRPARVNPPHRPQRSYATHPRASPRPSLPPARQNFAPAGRAESGNGILRRGEGRQTKAPQRRGASEAKSRPRGIAEKNGKPTDTISHVRHQRSLDRTGGLNKGEFLAHRNVHRSGWLFRFLVAQTSQTGRTCYAHT
jgi:hypothetical protein